MVHIHTAGICGSHSDTGYMWFTLRHCVCVSPSGTDQKCFTLVHGRRCFCLRLYQVCLPFGQVCLPGLSGVLASPDDMAAAIPSYQVGFH